jgi:hypothetical protein
MTFTFKLSRRIARLRAPVVAAFLLSVAGCNSTDSFNPDTSIPAGAIPAGSPSLATVSFAGGIPFGTFAHPTTGLGARYNGAKQNIAPEVLLRDLADIKANGGRITLMMAGNPQYYVDGAGHFNLSMWKARIDRYKGVNFSSYVSDGTIIAHYLIDEPNDPANWNGVPVPPSVLEEMAKYSKQLWPTMATVVRVEPAYLGSNHQYLDAAWAQYLSRRGDATDYIRKNVADAQARGLGLVVGLNILMGGNPNATPMTASEVESFGSALLSSTYPCAFISWQYNAAYLSSSDIGSAMDALRNKAENRSTRSCSSSNQTPVPPPTPTTPPTPTPTPTTPPTPPPTPIPVPIPTPTPSAEGSLPFGISLMPAAGYSTRWTGALYRANPADLVKHLDLAEASRMKVLVMLVSAAQSRNSDGTFSLTKWKAQVDRFRSLPLDRYISSKTLYLHHLMDQPSCASCWGGTAVPWETVEEMARYSKSIWPSLPTSVRVPPSKLAEADFRWTYLDAGWAQYNTRMGNVGSYLATQVAQAKSEGLGLVAGLNLLDGAGVNTPPMTASQIEAFGTVLAQEPSVCALVPLKYDASYLSQAGIGAALDSVAKIAKGRTGGSCVVD